jgi:hypothetical protein
VQVRRRLTLPARRVQEERDAAAAADVVHHVRQRDLFGGNRDAVPGGDANRRLDDRLALGQLARRRLVRAVAVPGVGALAEQDAPVASQQQVDIHHDPAACTRSGTLTHCNRLCPSPTLPGPLPCAL